MKKIIGIKIIMVKDDEWEIEEVEKDGKKIKMEDSQYGDDSRMWKIFGDKNTSIHIEQSSLN